MIAGVLLALAAAVVPTVDAPESAPENAMITVTAPAGNDRVQPPSVSLGPDALLDRQPRSMADALRGLPGVTVRPNSRGESVPRVRGAEERQTQVFLDGAPLSVPWDGRVDLGLLPAGLIGRVDVKKGAVPIEYGTNAVAGVVDLQTRRDAGFAGVAQAGTFGIASLSGALTADLGGAGVTVAAAHNSQDAARVADPQALPYSQADSRRRTNTDSSSNSLFAAIGGDVGGVMLRGNILHFNTNRGIAPESDRDPARFAPRFWRYPNIDFTQASVSAQARPGAGVTVRAVGWRQWFGQTIEAYRSIDYAALRSREQNEDDSVGGRLTVSHPAGPLTLRWSASAQSSTHVQIDTAIPPGIAGARLRYRQNLLSLGGEADVPLAAATSFTAGLGYDRAANPLTGDKPAQPDAGAVAISAALRHRFEDGWTLTVSGGRRTRFPSARELFGEALGRFLPNPDLRPETAWLADAELVYRGGDITVTLNPFFVRSLDGIGQRVVRVGSASLRQRYNLGGSTTFGMDGLVSVALGDDLTAEVGGTVLSAEADAGDAPFRRLVQRPRYEATAAIDWAPGDRFDIRAELRQTGDAVDLDPDGAAAVLPASTEINLRAAVPVVRFAGGRRLSVTAAVDNLGDALVLPQLGLPLPGRTVRIGIRVQ